MLETLRALRCRSALRAAVLETLRAGVLKWCVLRAGVLVW